MMLRIMFSFQVGMVVIKGVVRSIRKIVS